MSYCNLSPHRNRQRWLPILVPAVLAITWLAGLGQFASRIAVHADDQAKGIEFFEKQIRPVLHAECLMCHHQGKANGSLELDSREGWKRGGDSGPAIVPGDPDASLLIQAIRHQVPGLEMPNKSPKLPDSTIDAFVTWVRMGAPDPRDKPEPLKSVVAREWDDVARERAQWWCWQPIHDQSKELYGPAAIDHWIDRTLKERQIEPSQAADRRTLLRRLSFQLTGLPPSYEDVQAFEQNRDPIAWEQCVDKMLAQPAFGVHWARHWLDVVRYAETHGSEDDALLPFSYRYRDYVIRSFQNDVSYDQWIREHLAGDLLPPRWNAELGLNEAAIGPAFLRFVEFNQTPVDVKREEIVVIDNQIDAIGKTFQGITISCARCHDHKFDPISDEDFYALYGILRSSRTCMRVIDDPAIFDRDRAQLLALQKQIRDQLAPAWFEQLSSWPTELTVARAWCQQHCKPDTKWEDLKSTVPDHAWTRALAHALSDPNDSPLAPLARLVIAEDDRWPEVVKQETTEHQDRCRRSESLPEGARLLFDLSDGQLHAWRAVGIGLPELPLTTVGSLSIQAGREVPLAGILEPGFHSNLVSDRHGGSLRSPGFTIQTDEISLLVRGSGDARARLVIENFQGDSLLFDTVNPKLNSAELRWVTMPIRPQWLGLRAHIELLTRDDKPYVGIIKDPSTLEQSDGRSSFGIARVVEHARGAAPTMAPSIPDEALPTLPDGAPCVSRGDWIEGLSLATRHAIERWNRDEATVRDARWLTALIDANVLSCYPEQTPALAALLQEYRQIESAIPVARRVPSVQEDHCAVNQPWLPRGDHKRPEAEVPRRYLNILGSRPETFAGTDSGRLQLATAIASPENPLTARVYVNRVWHWMFGAGLVSTVDNFGRMGEPPTHPELLDHLAAEFIRDGWSTKKLIRDIVLSQTWQRSSLPTESALRIDPANQTWARGRLRRLDAESIRDTLLAAAGNMRARDEGLGTLVYYRAVMEPNKQSPPGPLGGDGRRSIFLEVRRNFPNEFLLAFDFPRPFAPAGRRSMAIVPGQSLTLLNDPFVVHQSKVWAERVCQSTAEPAARVSQFYHELLSRDPTDAERRHALDLVAHATQQQSESAAWELLAHALFNLKEAIYLP